MKVIETIDRLTEREGKLRREFLCDPQNKNLLKEWIESKEALVQFTECAKKAGIGIITTSKIIEFLEICDEKLLYEVRPDLNNLAREQARRFIKSAIDCLKENECDERG